jgi:hypothetical protein
MSTLTRYLNRMLLVRFLVIFFAVGGFAGPKARRRRSPGTR